MMLIWTRVGLLLTWAVYWSAWMQQSLAFVVVQFTNGFRNRNSYAVLLAANEEARYQIRHKILRNMKELVGKDAATVAREHELAALEQLRYLRSNQRGVEVEYLVNYCVNVATVDLALWLLRREYHRLTGE